MGCSTPVVSGTFATYGGSGCEITNEYIKSAGLYISFTHITIDAGPRVIHSSAFDGCSSLEKVTISESIQEIQANAFPASPKLSLFEVNKLNKNISTDSKALYDVGFTKLLRVAQATTSITLPDTLEYLDAMCFQYCIIKEVILPPKVTFIGNQCFYGGTVVEVKFAAGSMMTIIPSRAFCWWSAKVIHIPPSVVEIQSESFLNGYCNSIIFDDIESSNLTKIGTSSLSPIFVKSGVNNVLNEIMKIYELHELSFT